MVDALKFERLRRAHLELQEDFAVLVRCMETYGRVNWPLLHRERFDATLRRFPLGPSPSLADALGPGLTRDVLQMSGRANDMRALRGTCMGCMATVNAFQTEVVYVLGGMAAFPNGSEQPFGEAERLDPKGEWENLPGIGMPRFGTVAGVLHGKLYLCGGDGEWGLAVSRFNPRRKEWEHDPPSTRMSTPRSFASAAAVDGRLYVCGGEDRARAAVHCSVDVFDPLPSDGRGVWQALPSQMAAPRRNFAVAAIGGPKKRLLACGGFSHSLTNEPLGILALKSVEVLSLPGVDGSWRLEAPMPIQRAGHAAAVMPSGCVCVSGGEPAVSGGQLALHSVECFDPAAGLWSALPCLSIGRLYHTMVCAGGCLYVLGGSSPTAMLCSGERFDPSRCAWSPLPDMQWSRFLFSAVVVKAAAVVK